MTHISYSELKTWAECPRKHKLVYIDKEKGFTGNEYTAFGSSLHALCENAVQDLIEESDYNDFFDVHFERELEQLGPDFELRTDLVEQMREQAKIITPLIMPSLTEHFGEFELVSTEEDIYESIEGFEDYNFKGFIDLVIKTPDGKFHVIDWKTCSWGWNMNKRTDPMTTYQLTYYKHFYAKKHNVEPSDIQTHFALLKRTAKKDHVEFFLVSSGNKKTNRGIWYRPWHGRCWDGN